VRVNALQAIYRYWLALLVAAIVVQIGSAGYGAFYAADKSDPGPMTQHQFEHGFSFHGGFGTLIVLGGILALLLALVSRQPRRTKIMALVLALLLVIQVLLAGIGTGTPAVGTLHPLNAFLILGLTGRLTYEAWSSVRHPATAPA
jgi:hypothetical protein